VLKSSRTVDEFQPLVVDAHAAKQEADSLRSSLELANAGARTEMRAEDSWLSRTSGVDGLEAAVLGGDVAPVAVPAAVASVVGAYTRPLISPS